MSTLSVQNITGVSNLSISGPIAFASGTSSIPSISSLSSPSTGIFFPAANTIAFTEGGVEAVRIDSLGRVGIGTASPSYKLTSVYSGSNTAITDYVFVGGSETYQMVGLSENTAANEFSITNKYSSGGIITLRTGTGGTISERMRIDGSGNVGIGTASPSSRFDVRGGDGTGGISGPTSGVWASKIVMNQDASGYSGLSVQSRWANETTPIFEVASGWNGSAAGYYPVYTVSGTGVAVWKSNAGTERMRIDSNGHTVPGATNTYDLGTTSLRWRNIYTQDLHLSNGIGDYTVIEGEEDLFLVNNKSGRSFKFALIEVDPSIVPPKSS